MPKRSAGIVLYRRTGLDAQVFLVHPGGPFWANKDDHSWSIPKGEYAEGDDPEATARREFREETGHPLPDSPIQDLGEIRQAGGKLVRAWALEGDLDASAIQSNTFEMEWPPSSGRRVEFPEVDRAEWFDLPTARTKLHKGQVGLIDALESHLDTTLLG